MTSLPDSRLLRSFAAVAREGNVTRAAEVLNLTQPAVSLHLKRLAEETGLTLFRRTPQGLELTREGAALAVKAESTLAALLEFNRTARSLVGSVRGTLRLGTIIDPGFIRLGAFLRRLVETAPALETELLHGMSGDVPRRILRGDLDAGYFLGTLDGLHRLPGLETLASGESGVPADATGTGRDAATTFDRLELTRFSYWVIAPPGWESRVRGKDWPALARLPWIATPPASIHNRLLGDIFAARHLDQNKVAQVDQEASMLEMVRSGIGLSLCRDSVALAEKQAHGIVINDCVEIETALGFIAHRARREEPNIDCAFRIAADLWRGPHGD